MNARLLTAMETEQALANLLSDLKASFPGESMRHLRWTG